MSISLNEIAEKLKASGLYLNFDCHNEFSQISADGIQKYFKGAGSLCRSYRYSNPYDISTKNIIVHIDQAALDICEVIDKKWLDSNISRYYKYQRPYISYANDHQLLLIVSKAFRQYVLLDFKRVSDKDVILHSNSKIDGSSENTNSLEYLIRNSCFYDRENFYRGIDWIGDNNDRSNNALIGYPSPYYNLLMYSMHSKFFLTNFSWNISDLMHDYIEVLKFFHNSTIAQAKTTIDNETKHLNAIEQNKSIMNLELAILMP